MASETAAQKKARLRFKVFAIGIPVLFVIGTVFIAIHNSGTRGTERLDTVALLMMGAFWTFLLGLIPIFIICWIIYWLLSLDIEDDPKTPVFKRHPFEAGIASADDLKGLGVSDER